MTNGSNTQNFPRSNSSEVEVGLGNGIKPLEGETKPPYALVEWMTKVLKRIEHNTSFEPAEQPTN